MIKSEAFIKPESPNPKAMVLFLHGLGSNGDDLISLASYFKDKEDIVFLAPNGYQNFQMGGSEFFGQSAFQWFGMGDLSVSSLYNGLEKASAVIEPYIDKKLKEYNLNYENLIVIGFSQGAMLALHHFLKIEYKVKGIIAISGALIDYENFVEKIKTKPDILALHGNLDEVISFKELSNIVEKLEKVKINVEKYVMNGVGHYISREGVEQISNFCYRKLFLEC